MLPVLLASITLAVPPPPPLLVQAHQLVAAMAQAPSASIPHSHDRWVTLGKYAGTILGVLEMGISEACIQRGVCSEVNRFMPDGRSNADTVGRMTIKGSGIVALLWIIERLEQQGQVVLARIAAGGFVLANGWLAVNAYRHLGEPMR